MSDLPNVFENKRERQDFWIAIAVILLFAFIMLRMTGCWDKTPLDNEPLVAATVAVDDNTIDSDADNDGIIDALDKCPNLAGVSANSGCPLDSDNDGIYDADDKCPTFAGSERLNGCPPDSDKDGVHNGIDKCPKIAGTLSNDGCPEINDADGDGIADEVDKCPTLAGIAANNGCPEVKVDEADLNTILVAAKEVKFKTGSAALLPTSLQKLNDILAVMKKYPKYKLRIEGHTDSQGDDTKNLELSKARAKTCYDVLVSNGVKARRLVHKGFGEKRPIDTNDTPQGQRNNRRVEFHFQY